MRIDNFIRGERQPPASGQYLPNFDPATGQPWGDVAASGKADIGDAVAAANKAFPAWATLLPEQRAAHLHRLADEIAAETDKFAEAESRDTGKPLRLARTVDIPRAVRNFRFFASAAEQFSSESHQFAGSALNYTLRQPHGVVACISPWNLPLYLFSWKVAPALAAGNCVVGKPSEVTPATANMLAAAAMRADLPVGVLNIVHGAGTEAGAALIAHPDVRAISFTGGTRTGATIASIAAPQFKKLSLELGGKNANIIFDDADFETALQTSVRAAFSNQGQICLCGSRIFVQRSVYSRFRDAFAARATSLKTGDPQHQDSDLGAVVSEAHLEKILGYIALAREEGGKIICGGERLRLDGRCRDGWFLPATVIENLGADSRCNHEEIFGPVASLIPFDDEAEVLDWANSTRYGLATTLWTQNLTRAHRMAEKLQSGIVWINCWMLRDLRTPFGGTKDSGVGREGGWEAMRFFTEPKNISIHYGSK